MDEMMWPTNPPEAERHGLHGHCPNMVGWCQGHDNDQQEIKNSNVKKLIST